MNNTLLRKEGGVNYMNQVFLVGRITEEFEIEEKDGKKIAKNILAVNRQFKNSDGIYETDFFPFYVYDMVASNTIEYCHKGDLLGIKGKLSCTNNNFYVNAERITFLSSKIEKSKDEEIKEISKEL